MSKSSRTNNNYNLQILKRSFFFFFLLVSFLQICNAQCTSSPITVFEESFETDGNGIRYISQNEFLDGPNDYYGRVRATDQAFFLFSFNQGTATTEVNYSGQDGSFFYAAEDLDDTGGIGNPDGQDVKQLSIDNININGGTDLCFSMLAARGENNGCGSSTYDAEDYVEVYYSVDGMPEVKALCFNPDLECNIPNDLTNQPLYHDPNCDGDGGEGTLLSNVFQEFTFSIPNGSELDLRIEIHMDANKEEFAFDHLRVRSATPITEPEICPDITGPVFQSESRVCEDEPFAVRVQGLSSMGEAENNDQDYGIRFVAFESTPADPYIGGIDLGIVPFANLTTSGFDAVLQGATISTAERYEIYAVLSPTPSDVTCRPSAMTSIIVDANASFEYGSASYCTDDVDPSPTSTVSGGTYSSSPAGLDIDASTGTIDLDQSLPGTYTVTYNVQFYDCSPISSQMVTINVDDATFAYGSSSYCTGDANPTPTITGVSGGTFSSTSGLSLNASTGEITTSTSTPGNYTITYMTQGTCSASSTQMVTINAADDATFAYDATSYCTDDTNPTPTISGTPGGTFSSDAALSLNASTGEITTSTSAPGNYTVTYITQSPCSASTTQMVTINAADDATFEYDATSYCTDDTNPTPTISGTPGGSFSSSPAGLMIDVSTGEITTSTSTVGSYTVTYMTSGSCPKSSTQIVDIACECFMGDNIYDGTDGDWFNTDNWSLGCIPATPYMGNLTISQDVNTMTLEAFSLTGNLVIANGAIFTHDDNSTFAVDGMITIDTGGELKNMNTISTTGGVTNNGTYSGGGTLDGNFTNNGTLQIRN